MALQHPLASVRLNNRRGHASTIWRATLLPIAAGILVVALVGLVLLGGNKLSIFILVACLGIGSLAAAVAKKPVLIAALLVSASAGQRSVGALTENANALWLDDIVLVGMAFFVFMHVQRNARNSTKWIIVAILGVLAVAAVRSPDLGLGISQFRQMAVPLLLLLFGTCLSKEDFRRTGPIVVVVIFLGALYGLGEELGFRPIDPGNSLGLNSYAHAALTRGLPNSYFYYFSDGTVLNRAGGLILNPPSFGMLVAAGLLWTWALPTISIPFRVISSAIFIVTAFFAFGRGGFVILALAIIQPIFTRLSGRLAFGVVGAVLAYIAATEWTADGQSARHVDGFFGGISYALSHPIGGGFGTAGNSLSELGLQNDSGANESLAAILMASIGWIGIVIVAWLLYQGVIRGSTIPGVALTGAILVSLVSETAGGLDATGPLWILGGYALTTAPPVKAKLADRRKTIIRAKIGDTQ